MPTCRFTARLAICLAGVGFCVASPAPAMPIDAGLVFAHDFENIAGNTITALFGPDADKTPNVTPDSVDPVGPNSTQHVQAPARGGNNTVFATIDTNTRLASSAAELSFSIFYNARNDSFDILKRFLSTYDGTGPIPAGQFIFDRLDADGTLRFITGGGAVNSDAAIPEDDQWHQVGFTFNGGTVRFYLDGSPFGTDKTHGSGSIAAQGLNWHLLEDALAVSALEEYYYNGDYDDAALWTRALSDEEMNAVFTRGLASALVPEPTTFALFGLGLAGLLRRGRRTPTTS